MVSLTRQFRLWNNRKRYSLMLSEMRGTLSDRRETGRSLSVAGVYYLRGVGLSKQLLLSGVIQIANSANNGETLILASLSLIFLLKIY